MEIRILYALALAYSSAPFADALPEILDPIKPEAFFLEEAVSWEMVQEPQVGGGIYVKWRDQLGQLIEVAAKPATGGTIRNIYRALAVEVAAAIASADGSFLVNEEFFAVASENLNEGFIRLHLLAGTPSAAYLWSYSTHADNHVALENFRESLTSITRDHQYKEAKSRGNVVMGAWANTIQAYARFLAKRGSSQAETVYRQLLQVDASNIQAHAEYMLTVEDLDLAKASAEIVLNAAERAELLESAARIINKDTEGLDSFPILEKRNDSLRVVLIPLSPYNPWIMQEVAETYELITSIPVVIRNLPEPWQLSAPTRSKHRPVFERLASRIWPDVLDFSSWSLESLRDRISEWAKNEGPAAQGSAYLLFESIDDDAGQWDAGPLVKWLWHAVEPYASHAPYNMYVGITEADIYSKDSRFIFSLYGGYPKAPVSVLSYARMTASSNREQQSRQRLVQRIAKELVSATLKRFAIPRSVDPSCPYSYANGVKRLDEKTLTLSSPVQEKIRQIKSKLEDRK